MTVQTETEHFRRLSVDGNRIEGVYNDYDFWAVIYLKPSLKGIEGGRVSELQLDGIDYNRKWLHGEERRDVWGPLVASLEAFAQTQDFEGQYLAEEDI